MNSGARRFGHECPPQLEEELELVCLADVFFASLLRCQCDFFDFKDLKKQPTKRFKTLVFCGRQISSPLSGAKGCPHFQGTELIWAHEDGGFLPPKKSLFRKM